MARTQFTFTFTNAQPGAAVSFLSTPVFADASTTVPDGPTLVLSVGNTVSVWADAGALTAHTVDGNGAPLSATATASAPSVTSADGTPGQNPFGAAVESVVAGSGISVDATDPANPIVAATGGGSVQVAHLRLEPAWIIAHSQADATQVLVAGDATKAIIPLAGVASLTYATTAYTGAGSTDTDVLVGFGDPLGTPADMLGGPLSVWSATANTVAQLPQFANGGSQLVSQPPGADLRLYLLGSGLADGDSPVDVWVTYVLQTL